MKLKRISTIIFACLIILFGSMFFVNNTNLMYYCESNYSGGGPAGELYNVEINYDSYTITDAHVEKLIPNYDNYTQPNSCAPMAAALVVTYYDITKTNLIPNYEPGYYYEGEFDYRGQNATFNGLKETLYDYMGTNSIKPGTSVSQFKTGLKNYVNDKGYNISYNSCGNSLNYTTVKNYLNAQQPIVLFLNSYDYFNGAGVLITDTQMTMMGRFHSTGHVAVAFGYQQFKFYKNGVNFRTDNYLLVSLGDDTQGFIPVNNTAGIDEAYAINIY